MKTRSLLAVPCALLLSTAALAGTTRCRVGNGKGSRELMDQACVDAQKNGEAVTFDREPKRAPAAEPRVEAWRERGPKRFDTANGRT
jgi:hypothetical protein